MTVGSFTGGLTAEKQRKPKTGYGASMALPLPPPPAGLTWRRPDGGTWTLVETPAADADGADEPWKDADGNMPTHVEHVVLESDTLAGICIRYKVKERALRQENRFDGARIHALKVLRIPAAKLRRGARLQEDGPAVREQQLMGAASLARLEARVYLANADGDVAAALAEALADAAFEGTAEAEQVRTAQSRARARARARSAPQPPGAVAAAAPVPIAEVGATAVPRRRSASAAASTPTAGVELRTFPFPRPPGAAAGDGEADDDAVLPPPPPPGPVEAGADDGPADADGIAIDL